MRLEQPGTRFGDCCIGTAAWPVPGMADAARSAGDTWQRCAPAPPFHPSLRRDSTWKIGYTDTQKERDPADPLTIVAAVVKTRPKRCCEIGLARAAKASVPPVIDRTRRPTMALGDVRNLYFCMAAIRSA